MDVKNVYVYYILCNNFLMLKVKLHTYLHERQK